MIDEDRVSKCQTVTPTWEVKCLTRQTARTLSATSPPALT